MKQTLPTRLPETDADPAHADAGVRRARTRLILLAHYRSRHWLLAVTMFAATTLSLWLLAKSLDHAGNPVLPKLQHLERSSPP